MSRLPTLNRSALALMARVRSGRGGSRSAHAVEMVRGALLCAAEAIARPVRRYNLKSRLESLYINLGYAGTDVVNLEAQKLALGFMKSPTVDQHLKVARDMVKKFEGEIAEVNAELAALEAGQ